MPGLRVTGLVTAMLASCVLNAGVAVAAGSARPGLDAQFANRGIWARNVSLFEGQGEGRADGTAFAATPGGGALVALTGDEEEAGLKIFKLDRRGRLDKTFGSGGRVHLDAAEIRSPNFRLAGIAVDPQGRELVAGNTSCSAYLCSRIILIRLLPDGKLDPSFGYGGVVSTDLGLTAPYPATQTNAATQIQAIPSVSALTVDASGRIVIVGSAVSSYYYDSYRSRVAWHTSPLIARFSEDGQPDPAFGTDGAEVDRQISLGAGADLAIDGQGRILFPVCSYGIEPEGVVRVGPEGTPDASFGPAGMRSSTTCVHALAIAPHEKILALLGVSIPTGEVVAEAPYERCVVQRWSQYGLADRSFGEGGQVRTPGHAGLIPLWQDLAVDKHGKTYLFGEAAKRTGGPSALWQPQKVVATRLTGRGRPDRSFGPPWGIVTRVGSLASAYEGTSTLSSDGQLLGMVWMHAAGQSGRVRVLRYR